MIPDDLKPDDPDDLGGIEKAFRAEDLAQPFAQSFVGYVLKEAGQRTITAGFDRDAVLDARNALWKEGFRTDWDEDEPDTSIFAPPKLYHDLRDDLAADFQLEMSNKPDSTTFQDILIYSDPSIPEDTAIAIHHDAIAPPPQFSAKRPWIVKYPEGVVEIQVKE